jgi:Na+/glutamate symporter
LEIFIWQQNGVNVDLRNVLNKRKGDTEFSFMAGAADLHGVGFGSFWGWAPVALNSSIAFLHGFCIPLSFL